MTLIEPSIDNGRFIAYAQPPRPPGQCFVCRSVANGPFIDTSVDDSFLGVFYICKGCLGEMARKAGFIVTEPGEPTVIADDERAVIFQKGWEGGLSAIKDDVSDLVNRYLSLGASSDDGTPSGESLNVQDDPERQDGSGEVADRTAKQVRGSSKRQGPAGLSDDSDIDNLLRS